jgi:hemerythrin-like domain-containing protein
MDHQEVFTKVNLLEKALINFINTQTTENMKKTLEEQLFFLEAFEKGLAAHFAVEEKALFPEMLNMGSTSRTLVDELMTEHNSIVGKIHLTMQVARPWEERVDILQKMLRELATHAQKEETQAFPIVEQMSSEQLNRIDQASKQLGYKV